MFESDCKPSKAIFEVIIGVCSLIFISVSDSMNPVLLAILVTLSIMSLLDAMLIGGTLYTINHVSIATQNILKKRYSLWRSMIMVVAIFAGLSQGLKIDG